MQNKVLTALSLLFGAAALCFMLASFVRILTYVATSGVVVALFSLQILLLGVDLWLQERKILSAITALPAILGLWFAFLLFA